MDGILNINKPQGMTSFSIVACLKRICGERRAGHAGTLDPLATGVLPVALGQATRVIEYLFDATKTYRAEIELGKTSATYDSTGIITHTADTSHISREAVETALAGFRGAIMQTPPMFSAVKHQGKPLYKLARAGLEVQRKSRPAQIYSLELTNWQPPVITLDIVCGKGTYIRSIAHDMGQVLGCGAIMRNLIRLKVGPFKIEDALTPPQLEEAFSQGYGQKYLYPLDYVLLSYGAMVLNKEQQCSLIHGAPITPEPKADLDLTTLTATSRSRVYTADGSFLGIVKYDTENHRWQPEKIFFKGCCVSGD
jgi:tRNA pseudouridine55 synthase